jgi:hypothetical protein
MEARREDRGLRGRATLRSAMSAEWKCRGSSWLTEEAGVLPS